MNSAAAHRDWLDGVEAIGTPGFFALLRALELHRLQRYPAPRKGGIPFGHEWRILKRFLAERCSQLDTSAFAGVYRCFAGRRERLLYRAFVSTEPLARSDWSDIIGQETASAWTEHGLVEETDDGWLRCLFRVVSAGGITVLGDGPQPRSWPVHLGQDTLYMLEFLSSRGTGSVGRVLEVGVGTGMLLLSLGKGEDERVGLDINPRAVRAARLNAVLNGRSCRIEKEDIFQSPADSRRYGLVVWNVPFLFLPESERAANPDSDGGRFGIAMTIRFVRLLPSLLAERGTAFLMSAAPVLRNGTNLLETELRELAPVSGLDVDVHVLQAFWSPRLAAYHRAQGIERFESVFLEVAHGTGRTRRHDPPFGTRLADAVRGMLLRRRDV